MKTLAPGKIIKGAAALFLIALVWSHIRKGDTPLHAPISTYDAPHYDPSKSTTTEDDANSMAHFAARQFIEARLKAPSTADFPSLDYTVNHLDNDSFQVYSYVDAQNSFGAKLRKKWLCEVAPHGDSNEIGNWRVSGFCGLIE